MAEVTTLFPQSAAPRVCADVVEMLEDMLEQAKRGEINAVLVAYTRPNRAVVTNWAGANGCLSLGAGAVAQLQFRYLSAIEASRT